MGSLPLPPRGPHDVRRLCPSINDKGHPFLYMFSLHSVKPGFTKPPILPMAYHPGEALKIKPIKGSSVQRHSGMGIDIRVSDCSKSEHVKQADRKKSAKT
jgi:hypothetical protein